MKTFNRSILVAAIAAAAAFAPDADAASWTAPVGVPTPSFGINESARPAPSPWTSPVAGYYYVDATISAATDSSNPYGTPAKPRRTIPIALPAGSVVELHGTYDANHESPRTIVASGTAANPVFIRGVSTTARPIARALWQVRGSYVVLENLEFGPRDSQTTGGLVILAPGDHIVLRHSNLHGNLTGGGMGIESWDGVSTLQQIVIYDNAVHDNGDVHASFDQDVHGIHIGPRVSNTWIIDNELAGNSGDGIQINADSAAAEPTTHHIYVARNTAHNNKQTGVWVKQATDVIVSENFCYSHRPSNSSLGQCMGFQYAAERVWFIANHIEDSEFGIGVSSDNNLGTGTQSYFVGNVIHNIHHTESDYNPGTSWSSSAIMLAGGIERHVINNSIYDVDAGINSPGAAGTLDIANNAIAKVVPGAGNHIFVELSNMASRTTLSHNVLEGDARMRLGDGQVHYNSSQLAVYASLNADPKFLNPANHDFHLSSNSPAIDAGQTAGVYATFQQRYGISIAKAPDGMARPQGSAWDVGAYEFSAGCSANSAPTAPTNLTATVQGTSILLSWIKPTCGTATGYLIDIGTQSGKSNLSSKSTGSTATTVTSTNWTPGFYFLRVRAQSAAGNGAASNEVTAAVGGVPAAPINLAAGVSGTLVGMSWAMPGVGPAATSYILELGSAPGLSDLGQAPLTTTWILTNRGKSGKYYVRVRAKDAAGTSWPSSEITVTVP
ncbi:MAG TPA: right-handed parallel beta-helix repeat-containing protein [Vicinamibacterales bacterium]